MRMRESKIEIEEGASASNSLKWRLLSAIFRGQLKVLIYLIYELYKS